MESEIELVDLADAALYLAKRGGRNRVVSRSAASAPVAPQHPAARARQN